MLQGIRFVARHRQLRLLASFSFFRMLFVAPGFILVFAEGKRLGYDTSIIGLLFSVGAVGGLLGSAISVPVSSRVSVRWISVIVNTMLAASFAILALGVNLPMLLAGEIVFNISFPILASSQTAYWIGNVPEQYLGRANAVFRLAIYGSGPPGLVLGAFFLKWTGPVISLLLVAAGLALVAVLTLLSSLGRADSSGRPIWGDRQVAVRRS